MNRHRPLVAFIAFSLAALSTLSAATSASAASENQQKKACKGDAMHFCKAEIPNREKIKMCLTQHMSELSPGCQAMFKEGKKDSSSQPANNDANDAKPDAQ
jgi:hypothetical protein